MFRVVVVLLLFGSFQGGAGQNDTTTTNPLEEKIKSDVQTLKDLISRWVSAGQSYKTDHGGL